MAGFDAAWCLCGGWALDAWLGRQTREHHDVDIAVFEDDLASLRPPPRRLAASSPMTSSTPTATEPWTGRRLLLPAHIHARSGDYEIDVQVNRRTGDRWLISRSPRITRSLRSSVTDVAWGLPALVPELVLYYKAIDLRDKDGPDLANVAPSLTKKQVDWLRASIARTQPDHPWLPRLEQFRQSLAPQACPEPGRRGEGRAAARER